ncbi:MAG: NusG domain II-containing protein [Clostridia bacterium]|nr:NusG domain II-containing protein [Clostridia bacterium]
MNEEKLCAEVENNSPHSVKKRIRNDIILVLAIILFASIALLVMLALRSEGGAAVVTVNGKPYASLPLDKDAELIIQGEDGGYNILVIKDGEAYIREADCPDKICVKHRRISYSGETIVCLPNGVSVKIEGSGGGVDAVS